MKTTLKWTTYLLAAGIIACATTSCSGLVGVLNPDGSFTVGYRPPPVVEPAK